ncbi:hypothetical protein [Streptomyces sp. TRM49041]|uniref:hypothetical protein n=1 Tax=Streptomyces sp. TRM49041 TaxID=2603216 RepID=UPI0021CCFDB6|nr:hypothetical protein [Streptomyces sp. TRM49041]
MMAWDEWDQIKAEAGEGGPASMRLNQLAPIGGGGGTGNLASSLTRKKKAAKAIDDLVRDAKTHGDDAEESTASAVKEFGARDGDGWDTAPALKKAHATWEKQVKALVDRLVYEKNGLMQTGNTLRGNDIDIGTQLRLRSKIADL